jgi:cytosine permease
VIAPTFTTLYSGVPALRAAVDMSQTNATLVVGLVGMALAVVRFDLWLLAWLGILAAILPPLVVPLAFESTSRRMGRPARIVPMWVWLAGAAAALALTVVQYPLALLVGLIVSAAATIVWYWTENAKQRTLA